MHGCGSKLRTHVTADFFIYINWLVVWNMNFIFPYIYILGIMIPTDSYFSWFQTFFFFPFHIWHVILPIDSYFSRWLLYYTTSQIKYQFFEVPKWDGIKGFKEIDGLSNDCDHFGYPSMVISPNDSWRETMDFHGV